MNRTFMKIAAITLVFLFWLPLVSQAQDTIPGISDHPNTIKGMAFVLPLFAPFIVSSSLGYERRINANNSVELTSSYFLLIDEMGNKTEFIAVKPGFNHYLNQNNNKGPIVRLGGYLAFNNDIPDQWGTGAYNFGLGGIAGLRFKLSKNFRWFFDFALGGTLNYSVKYEVYRMTSNSPWQLYPRLVVHFGHQF